MPIQTLKRTTTVLAGLLFLSTGAFGQAVKVKVDKPEFDELLSPEVGGNTGEKKFFPKDWLEAEVEIKIQAKPEPADGYLDSLSIRWFVAVEDPGKKGSYLLLEKEINYVNIPVDEDFFASVYLSPSSIKRLTGGDRAGSNSVWGVAGEISFNGSRVAEFSSRSEKEWWRSSKLVRTDKFPLMSKTETPFKFLWYDRYVQEAEPRR